MGICIVMMIVASCVLLLVGADGNVEKQLWMQGLSQLLMFLFPAWLFAFLFYGKPMQYFNVDVKGKSWMSALVGVVVMLLLLPGIDVLTRWNDGWHFSGSIGAQLEEALRAVTAMSEDIIESFVMRDGFRCFLENLLIIALVPAICEEVLFRGAVQQVLQKWFKGNAHWAIVVTAIIFSMAHGDIFGFVPRFFMGVVLGYLFYYSGSLIVNICAHFVNNALIVVLYYMYNGGVIGFKPDEIPSVGWVWTVLCTLAAGLLMYEMIVRRCKKEEKAN